MPTMLLTKHQRDALLALLARYDEDMRPDCRPTHPGLCNVRTRDVGFVTALRLEYHGLVTLRRNLITTRGSVGRCPIRARERSYCDITGWLTPFGVEVARAFAPPKD